MGRLMGWCSLVTVLVLALAGCAGGDRSDDPAATAVRDAHSSVAGLVLSVSLLLDGKATAQVTQVALDQCLDDVATAQQELVTAADAEPARRTAAGAAVRTAVDTLVALGNRGADQLGPDDLARLRQAEESLAGVVAELHA